MITFNLSVIAIIRHTKQIRYFFLFLFNSQSVLQIAEFMFNDIVREVGYQINSTLESIPIVNTIKNYVSKAAQSAQV